jgi:crotonobetainyl-CoA:carnitine CoA-transferase CaiB-like acyl-CoA transferase
MSKPLADLPLAGLNVVEYPGSVATRYCGRLFARHGATVTQVGAPAATSVGYGGAASDAYASWLDDGKHRASDLSAAIAAAGGKVDLIIAGLDGRSIEAADAAIRSTPLGNAIRVGITWFAPEGPYAQWTGSDAIIQAMSGVAHPTGAIDGAPMLARGHAPQVVAGATAFIAGLAAVIGRDAGWRGRRIDLDILEANLCFMEGSVATDALGEKRTDRHGVNRFKTMFPVGIYRTSDGWIGVTANSPAQWVDLCDMIGLPQLARDERLKLTVQRVAHADELHPLLAAAFLTNTSDAWLVEGQRRRVPLAPVPDLAQLPELPHWKGRRSFAPVPGYAAAVGPTMPFHIESLPPVAADDGPARPKAERPLEAVRVLDLSMGWSGPLATRHLADLGAEVIKGESCVHLDWWRGFYTDISISPPPYETRPNFLMVNRNKRGATLDLKSEAGRKLVFALARSSDVMIENYAPGALDKLGLSARTMIGVKPDLVHLSMGAFGATGPWRGFRGYGTTVEQASGLPFVNGEPDDPPTMQHAAYGDPVAGLFGAVACLVGLYDRARRKRGALIDLGQVECLFQLGADAIIAQSLQRERLARDGSRHPLAVLRCVCPTSTARKWIAVTAETPARWNVLARAIGRSDLALADGTLDALKRQEESLEAALHEWCAQREGKEAVATLQAAGISAGPVHATLDLLDDPQLRQSGFWRYADRAFIGKHLTPHAPYTLDGERPPLTNPTPTLGQHNAEVLCGILGLSPAEVERLERDNVIGTRAKGTTT